MLMMLPRRPVGSAGDDSMCAPTSRHMVKTVERFTWSTVDQSDMGNSWGACRFWIPAQLSRMLMRWLSERMRGTREETESGEERSAV